MPYTVDPISTPLRVVCRGDVSSKDVLQILYEHYSPNGAPDRLIDLRSAEGFEFSSAEIMMIATSALEEDYPNSYRCAVLAAEALPKGIARMWQILNQHPDVSIEIFSGFHEAQNWLDNPDEAALDN